MPHDAIERLLAEQAGVVARRQALAAGVAPHELARLLRRREWVTVHPGVYVDHTGPLTWLQRAWAPVLHAWPAALCDVSALRAASGPGRRDDHEATIHVGVDRGRRVVAPAGVRIHRLARFETRVLWNVGPPRLRYEDAALDVAVSSPSDFAALGVLAEACQSRRTTARRLLSTMDDRPRLPRRAWLTRVLHDVADGTCSVLEHGYLTRVERPHGLPAGARQKPARTTSGGIYRDVEYPGLLVVELDGRLHHDSGAQRDRDFERDLDAALEHLSSIRLSWGQVFARPCSTAGKVATLLAHRGWSGSPRPCGRECMMGG